MQSFEERIGGIPEEIKTAWSPGFVFVREKEKFWHFPARQWSEKQIQDYFLNRYPAESHFVDRPYYQVKQLVIENCPELFVIVPY